MRVLRLFVAVVCVALGAGVGVLNRQPVVVDFVFGRFPTSLGVALIVALLAGLLLGGFAAGMRRRPPVEPASGHDRRDSAPGEES